jgi:hypothetical protein
MSRIVRLAGIALFAFPFATAARSATIYADGLTHLVNSSSGDIVVSNATTLNVAAGAGILGLTATSQNPATPGITASANSTINVTGGAITGGSGGNNNGATGLSSVGSTVNISGGTLTGGSTNVGNSPGQGLLFQSVNTSLTISGGTFQGGDGGSGNGAYVLLTGPTASATISGGHFIAGSLPSSIFAGALRLFESNDTSVTISGGQFSGGYLPGAISVSLINNSTLTFEGTGFSLTRITDPIDPFLLEYQLTGTYLTGGQLSASLILTAPNEQYKVSQTPTSLTLTGIDPLPAVPEPASFVLYALGLLGVAGLARGHQRAAFSITRRG